MNIHFIRVFIQGIRFAARFGILLLILSVLSDLSGRIAICVDPSLPFVLKSVPFCFLLAVGMLIEGLGKGGISGLLWHYLPTIVMSLSIAIFWTLRDRRRKST